MIRSMTGYGSAKGCSGETELSVEIKSVNNRYFDCTVKIPRLYMFCEDAVKSAAQKSIARGKVDIYIGIDSSNSRDVSIRLNTPLAEAYIAAFRQLSDQFGLADALTNVAIGRLPEVFSVEKKEVDPEQFASDLMCVLDKSLAAFNEMRMREGQRLMQDILDRLCTIEQLAAQIEARSPESVAAYQNRLEQKMVEVLQDYAVDAGRILMEAAIFADKVAINEELVRLSSHIAQMRTLLSEGGAVGRKLDFIVQEMNREVNTIGSKCNDLEITKLVVDLKAEIEKIREQAQNIE